MSTAEGGAVVGNRPRDRVALTLAIGLCLALNLIAFSIVWVTVTGTVAEPRTLSENATQLLTAAFGGIVGVLGSYLGFRAGEHSARRDPPPGSTL